VAKYLSNEDVVVDSVRLCGDFITGRKIPNKATITVRIQVCILFLRIYTFEFILFFLIS